MLTNIAVEQVLLAAVLYNGTSGLYKILAAAMKCALTTIHLVKMFNAILTQTAEQPAG